MRNIGCTFIPVNFEDKVKIEEFLPVEIGLLGGSGNYDPTIVKNSMETKVFTPYGRTSDNFILGTVENRKVAFLARHGRGHHIPPHLINFRANIWAMKALGVTRIISPSACGSLQEDIDVGTFVIIDQLFDRTFGQRKDTFYEGSVVGHMAFAKPFCPELRAILAETATKLNLKFRDSGTYVCINGPRFSTAAESLFYRNQGWHVIGMTVYPECILAREAEICFTNVSMVTDKDIYGDEPVTIEEVLNVMTKNVENVRNLIFKAIAKIPKDRKCDCGHSLDTGIF
ncbi:MAG: S-methyl-5'-thioadenosine phosphorylase [Candidatus Helarchaeota archaeon]|nr:S-methyl-5'-thioadenosine phosphorylase [Candidatus Helarchaeota archaeon]